MKRKTFWTSPAGVILVSFLIILILALIGQVFDSLIHIAAIVTIVLMHLYLALLLLHFLDEPILDKLRRIFGQKR